MKEESIIKKLFFSTNKVEFIDRKTLTNENTVDVIIPIINSNLLFEKNLYSFYREIPINQLIIGNAGITDNSIEILKKFPRVKIVDHTKFISQGYCITNLISLVETEWFIYLHADVYLPKNWYDHMKKYQNKYDWYECDRLYLVFIEYKNPNVGRGERAYSGSQMGRKKAFENIITKIEDDFLQRNEDIILAELIKEEGFKYGRIFDTFHYHQIMNKKGELTKSSFGIKEPKYNKVAISRAPDIEWEKKIYNMQVRGIIKYCKPKKYLITSVNINANNLIKQGYLNAQEFLKWVEKTNKIWLKHLKIKDPIYIKIFKIIKNTIYPKIIKKLAKY